MSIISGGTSGSGGGIGSLQLVYRFTVTGSAKAVIDTGVDTPQAGTNDWTNCDLLEMFLYMRTDEVTPTSAVNLTLNNDTGATQYVFERARAAAGAISGALNTGNPAIQLQIAGASTLASTFTNVHLKCVNPTGTVGFKGFEITGGNGDTNAAQGEWDAFGATYRSTSALTRAAITPTTAAKNFVVGSQWLIYKRLAS